MNLLRIDEKYDDDEPVNGLDENDPWRVMNTYVHAPGAVGQILKANWNKYDEGGANPTTACESGSYYYFYDALGNVNGVLEGHGSATPAPAKYYRWEMDAFGNDLPGGNDFLPMDQPGPKEHLTGKLFDTITGLYYFHARWYDAEVGRFVSSDPLRPKMHYIYCTSAPNCVDPFGLKDYKIGTSDPAITYDPGAGAYGSEKPTLSDYAAKGKWKVVARSARALGLNNAADHMIHFLNNSGTMYTIDLKTMISEVASAKSLFYHEMNLARAYAESLPPGSNYNITSGSASSGYNEKSQSLDWFYAVGGYAAWGKGECCCGINMCYMNFEYKFADMYNWDPGKRVHIGPITVPDTNLGRLHLIGIAREYEMTGSHKYPMIWSRGERY